MPLARRRSALLVGLGGTAALILAGCGGTSASGTGGAAPTSSASSSRVAAIGRGPAASGTIAAITGRTMQVQNRQTGQVAVTWTGSTTFTHLVSTTVAAIKVGSCVTATGGSGTSRSATSFTAATLVVGSARGGSCFGGDGQRPAGFPGGARPSGFPGGARPSGFPSGARPSGFPSASGRAPVGAVASGTVTAVAGNRLTVAARRPGASGTASRTVITGSRTEITTQATTTASALRVGRCVSAEGTADTSGAVTATRVQISDPTDGRCGFGFGRFGGSGG